MKKLFLTMLLSSMAVVGLTSTHGETVDQFSPRNELTAKKALSTNGAYDPAGLGGYANMGLNDTPNDNLYVSKDAASVLKKITKDNLTNDTYGRSLKVTNQSLVVRLTNVSGGEGMCKFSFKYKRLSSDSGDKISIRFSHRLVKNGDGVFYMTAPAMASNNEWQTYTYEFYDNYFGDDASLNLAATGEFLVDDFKFYDGEGVNYFTDGDFEATDILRYQVSNAGIAKQDDGSIIFGIGRTILVDGTLGLAQFYPNGTVENSALTLEWKGVSVGACNRNGYSYFGDSYTSVPDTSYRENYAKWQSYSGTDSKNAAIPGESIFIYTPDQGTRLLFVRNVSLKDSSGKDYVTYKLHKEDYAAALADSILTYIDCNADGTHDTASNLGKWNTMKWCFGIAPELGQTYAIEMAKNGTGDDTFNNAIARYKIFVSKYGYSDFLGLGVTSSGSLYTPGMLNDASSIALYTVLGFTVAGIGIASFLVVRKKKRS